MIDYKKNSFLEVFESLSWDSAKELIYKSTREDVLRVLAKSKKTFEDFAVMLSPAAAPFLEQMANQSQVLTRQRFGNSMQLYVPLYLSNECHNVCTYCGFSMDNEIPRKTLNPQEILKEAEIIKDMGFDHVLLVTGEANNTVGVPYLSEAINLLRDDFSQISIEVQPLLADEYAALGDVGMSAVYVYQETYHKAEYKKHHPKGKKSIFNYRVETPDRLGQAKIQKVGLGVLLGLEDWRVDTLFTGLHLDYLEKKYWETKYSIAFPRLRPNAGGLEPKVVIEDRELAQVITAWRLFKPEVELSMSTRESPEFRNGMARLGVTTMSASSKTEPGGYAHQDQENLEQFEISDDRTVEEVCDSLIKQDLQPVFKDWDYSYDV
jgi:2-iminoacetate synthase